MFYDLPIWEKALDISIRVFELTSYLPKNEDYGLTSQIRRAANSIGANIAEGYGRKHQKDKLNFYFYARGSANETFHHLLYGYKIGYFKDEDFKTLEIKINTLLFELNKLIKTVSNWGDS